MKTVERTVDYETVGVTETLVVCHYCDGETAPEEAHPIDAAGQDVAFCTDCFVGVFSNVPKRTVDIETDGNRSADPTGCGFSYAFRWGIRLTGNTLRTVSDVCKALPLAVWETIWFSRRLHAMAVGGISEMLSDEDPVEKIFGLTFLVLYLVSLAILTLIVYIAVTLL